MNIEKQIQNLFSKDQNHIDADNFLDKLHSTRENKLRKQQRFAYGISAMAVILIIGLFTITQLRNDASDIQYNQYYAATDLSEEMIDEYYDDLMIYLADQSEDIWSTMEFYYEVNSENINTEN
jgi:hypothetical protein